MSVIMPVGKNSNDWSSEGISKGLTKTASTETKSDRDVFYDAAQKSIEANQKKKSCVNTIADGLATDKPETDKPETDKPVVTDMTDINPENVTKEDVTKEDVTKEDVTKEVKPETTVTEKIEKVEKAIDEVEVAVADVKDAVAPASDVVDTTDVAKDIPVDEVEIELDNKDETKPEDTEKDNEIIVESKEEKPEECKEEEIKTRASANTWQKLSAVSKETRDKVYDYYLNCLEYPKDYVDLLVKNYEK